MDSSKAMGTYFITEPIFEGHVLHVADTVMQNIPPLATELIAPCGMNCAVCSRYLAHLHHLKRSQCLGCRPANKNCSYLFKRCSGSNHDKQGCATAVFCFECGQYPCKQINRMDERYRKNYRMSIIDNLDCINKKGTNIFIAEQHRKYCCPKCGELLSTHNGKCFACDKITKFIEKQPNM